MQTVITDTTAHAMLTDLKAIIKVRERLAEVDIASPMIPVDNTRTAIQHGMKRKLDRTHRT